METYAQILNYAIPGFILLIGFEFIISQLMSRQVFSFFDTISSLSSGMTNVIKDVLGLTITVLSYGWMVDHFALFSIQSSISLYILTFIGLDFAGYWNHRFCHSINIFWNRHIIHHSSEEFNLACALRQSVSEFAAIFTFLYFPLAILGIPKEVIAVIAPLHLFAQFWYHTRLIDSMGWLEYIIVTPSHHRVHHAINPKYMDKNFGQIFIIWDKIFGTFQAELKTIPPVYGITRPAHSWNPWIINFKHIWLLITDAIGTTSWLDKWRIWFMPTGWRPADRISSHPVFAVSDPYSMAKYSTSSNTLLYIWATIQLFVHLGLMMSFFNTLGILSSSFHLLYGSFIFIGIFAYTSLMDGSKWSIWAEGIKCALGFYIFYMQGYQWLPQIPSQFNTMFIIYLVSSCVSTIVLYYFNRPIVIAQN